VPADRDSEPTTAIVESGEGVALPEVLHVVAAVIAAEGDIKLVAELTSKSEVEVRMIWLQNAKYAAEFARAFGLLTTVHLLGELKAAVTQDIERVSSQQVKLLELLLGSLGNLSPQPVLQQNNQYNFDNQDSLLRLAKRMGVNPMQEDDQPADS
jgi:hypothetical protein